eukprot:15433506-Alexandrium_andersonii.AAC.1
MSEPKVPPASDVLRTGVAGAATLVHDLIALPVAFFQGWSAVCDGRRDVIEVEPITWERCT